MTQPIHLSPIDRRITALLLTSIGGFVDAVGWIALLQVFTANMSGNSIHLGMAVGNLDFFLLRRFLCAIAAYIVGLVLTRATLEIAARVGLRRIASITFSVEIVLLLVFVQVSAPLRDGHIADQTTLLYLGMVVMLAFAMGIQTGTLTHLGPLTVYTTFVTGTLTKTAESFTRAMFWIHDTRKSATPWSDIWRGLRNHPDGFATAFLSGVWLCYVAGAALGTAALRTWELRAVYFPIAILCCLVLLDLVRPIAFEEEQEQHGGGKPQPTGPE